MTKIHDSEENQNLIRKLTPLIFCQIYGSSKLGYIVF